MPICRPLRTSFRMTLLLLLLLFVAPAPLQGTEADFAIWLEKSHDRLVAGGWPVDELNIPTNDSECQKRYNELAVEREAMRRDLQREKQRLRGDLKLTETQRNARMNELVDRYRDRAKKLGRSHQIPLTLYWLEKANFKVSSEGGSERDFATLAKKGTRPSSPKHGGALSDSDIVVVGKTAELIKEHVKLTIGKAKVTLGPVYFTEEVVDMTVFQSDAPEYKTYGEMVQGIRALAESAEVDLSYAMKDGQPCKKLVELQSFINKASKCLTADPGSLDASFEKLMSAAKTANKALESLEPGDNVILDCLKAGGLADMAPQKFREMLRAIKYDAKGLAADSVGLTPEKLPAFQKTLEQVFAACQKQAEGIAAKELAAFKVTIENAKKAKDPKKVEELQRLYLDSVLRTMEAAEANQRRLKGSSMLGDTYDGLRNRLEPVEADQNFRRRLSSFMAEMKSGRVSRKVSILVLNYLARNAPFAVRDAMDAAQKLDGEGSLVADADYRALRSDLDLAIQNGIPPERMGADGSSSHRTFFGGCKKRMLKLSSWIRADLTSKRSEMAFKGLDAWFGVQEALAYWEAFEQRGLDGVATEIVRFHVPLLENIVHENYLKASWEFVCILFPPAAKATLAWAFADQVGRFSATYMWDTRLELLLEELYGGSEFELVGTATFEDITIGKWEFAHCWFRGRELTRDDFLAEETGVAFGCVDAEVSLRLAVASCDPALRMWEKLEREAGIQVKAKYAREYEERWEKVRRWWAQQTILKLEERMQAEDALKKGHLLDAMFKLDIALRELDAEDWVRAGMFWNEYSKSEKAYLLWVNLRTLNDDNQHLFSAADDATRKTVRQLATKELRFLAAYRNVLAARQAVETALEMPGVRDGEVRLLTGPFFLSGRPAEDARAAGAWLTWLPRRMAKVEQQLLALKRTFVIDGALDTEFDRKTRLSILRHLAWARGWREVELNFQSLINPIRESAAASTLGPLDPRLAWLHDFYSKLGWLKEYYDQGKEVRAEVLVTATTYLDDRICDTARTDHENAVADLFARFKRHYAGETKGRVRILVRRMDDGRKTTVPVRGATVEWVGGGETAEETGPGIYEFFGVNPGLQRFLASAAGFSGIDGEPAAFVNLTVPAVPQGTPPGAILYLTADALSIIGSVRDDRGEPIPHATVSLTGAPAEPGGWTLDAGDGSFSFTPVAPGQVTLEARAGGYRPGPRAVITVESPTRAGQRPEPVRFLLGPILSEVAITVRDGGGRAVPGATVELARRSAVTDASGRATFSGVRPDPEASLAVRKDGFAVHQERFEILPEREPSKIVRQVKMSGGVSLNVTVLDLDGGAPIRGANVAVSYSREADLKNTGRDGIARFTALRPEFVYLDVTGDGFGPRRNIEVDLTPLTAGETGNVEVRVEYGMRLRVLVKNREGELIPGAYVSLDAGGDRFAATGSLHLEPVKAGRHLITAKARGHTAALIEYIAKPVDRPEDSVILTLSAGLTATVEVRDSTPGAHLLRSPKSRITLLRDGVPVASAPGPVHTFTGLAEGNYKASATTGSAGTASSDLALISPQEPAGVLVVRAGILCALEVRVSVPADFDAPPGGVTIRLAGQGHLVPYRGRVVQFNGLLPGSYEVTATCPGLNSAGEKIVLAPPRPGLMLRVELALTKDDAAAEPPPRDPPPEDPPPPDDRGNLLDRLGRATGVSCGVTLVGEFEDKTTGKNLVHDGYGSSGLPKFRDGTVTDLVRHVLRFSADSRDGKDWEVSLSAGGFRLHRRTVQASDSLDTRLRMDTRGQSVLSETVTGSLSGDGRMITRLSYTLEETSDWKSFNRTSKRNPRWRPGSDEPMNLPGYEWELGGTTRAETRVRITVGNLPLSGDEGGSIGFGICGRALREALSVAESQSTTTSTGMTYGDKQHVHELVKLIWDDLPDTAFRVGVSFVVPR
jgi:Carboxypeptidase regulatory-like domain